MKELFKTINSLIFTHTFLQIDLLITHTINKVLKITVNSQNYKLIRRCFVFFIAIISTAVFSQEDKHITLEADYFYGTILEHNPDIGHLITHHPEGFVLQYNIKTFGEKEWERRHNYPDWGFTFAFQNMKNPNLGELYGLYSHISWYFLKRNLRLTVSQGIAYATNPYDSETNFRNNAFGTSLLSATVLKLNYHRPNIWKGFGLQSGISLFHYSNGNFKAPNTSTNTFALNLGVNYQLDTEFEPEYIPRGEREKFLEPIRFNLALRTGINESDVIGLGQHPFFVISAFADKRLSKSSSVTLGSELFLSYFLKDLIEYRAIAFPEFDYSGDEDFKRVGLFVGYELRINKLAPFVNLGHYIYYPYDFEGRTYNRLGIKRYFGENEQLFGIISVKSHAAKAESIEFGMGFRF